MCRHVLKFLALGILLCPLAAQAQAEKPATETKAAPYTYNPEGCEFQATFPEEPHTSKECEPGNKDRCYDLVSFNKVYGIDSSVKLRFTCSIVNEQMQKKYTREVMDATLRAMTRRSNVEAFDTTYREEPQYRQAGLVGEGQNGNLPNIYIAQLWMGKTSAMSVEAELIGDPHPDADKLFSDILKSVRVADEKKPEEPEAEKKVE